MQPLHEEGFREQKGRQTTKEKNLRSPTLCRVSKMPSKDLSNSKHIERDTKGGLCDEKGSKDREQDSKSSIKGM